MTEHPTYKFKWTNIDLAAFMEQRRYAAQSLRRDANLLMMRADEIEAQANEWSSALKEVTDD